MNYGNKVSPTIVLTQNTSKGVDSERRQRNQRERGKGQLQ